MSARPITTWRGLIGVIRSCRSQPMLRSSVMMRVYRMERFLFSLLKALQLNIQEPIIFPVIFLLRLPFRFRQQTVIWKFQVLLREDKHPC